MKKLHYLPIICTAAMLVSHGCKDIDAEQSASESLADPAAPVAGEPEAIEVSLEPDPEAAAHPVKNLFSLSERGLPDSLEPLNRAWTGDFDGMVERRVVRILTVYRTGAFFIDGATERGLTHDLGRMFEDFLNERLGTGHVRLHVVLIPVVRDQLVPGLLQGYGDIIAAGLTTTPELEEVVDFAEPLSREVREVIVSGPAARPLASLDELSGRTVQIRASSSFRHSLDRLNGELRSRGLAPVELVDAPEALEDVDLMEMVNAGLFPLMAAYDYEARFWVDIFEDIEVREDLVLQPGARIAWAIRPGSPRLMEEVSEFSRQHRQGTLMGNILINRYLKDRQWVKNALSGEDYERFLGLVDTFRKYSEQYGFDYLKVMAQGYQESRLDQDTRSGAGAIGIMQLLPSTAADPNVGIPDITVAEANIHAGIKYLAFLRARYFNDPDMDDFNKTLFAFAAYNAGPARVAGLRRKAAEKGLDPDVWLNNVELIAAREIGRETVQYVSNIYKYYIAYRLSLERRQNQLEFLEEAR